MKLKEYIQCIPHILKQRRFLRNLDSDPTKDNGTIISLTAIPSRFKSLHLVIASLLNQGVTSCPVHLWVDKSAEGSLPASLSRLTDLGLHIHLCRDVGPHTKLVHALERFPNSNIITADDDLLYPSFWLRSLLAGLDKNPDCVSGFICRQLELNSPMELSSYNNSLRVDFRAIEPSNNLMALGYAGVIYPAGLLPSDTWDEELFKKYCPHADDIWFKAMALREGILHCKLPVDFGKEIYLPFSQRISLKKKNVREGANDEQLKAVFDHYGLYGKLSSIKESTPD